MAKATATKKAPQAEEKDEAKEKKGPDYTEKVRLQVLAKTGTPPRLERVEVSHHQNGNYRVNIWQQREEDKDILVTPGSRILASYYLKVSDQGEIVRSTPPLARL